MYFSQNTTKNGISSTLFCSWSKLALAYPGPSRRASVAKKKALVYEMQSSWAQVPALPFACCVILDETLCI